MLNMSLDAERYLVFNG